MNSTEQEAGEKIESVEVLGGLGEETLMYVLQKGRNRGNYRILSAWHTPSIQAEPFASHPIRYIPGRLGATKLTTPIFLIQLPRAFSALIPPERCCENISQTDKVRRPNKGKWRFFDHCHDFFVGHH